MEALKPYRPEGFPDDPDAYRQMWRYDVGGGMVAQERWGSWCCWSPRMSWSPGWKPTATTPSRCSPGDGPNPDEELTDTQHVGQGPGSVTTLLTGATASLGRSAGWSRESKSATAGTWQLT